MVKDIKLDNPGLRLPGMPNLASTNDAKLLASILAIGCTRIALPAVPLLRPEDLMEFRDANAALLRAFRRSMLRYAADLNGKIKGMDREESEKQTQVFHPNPDRSCNGRAKRHHESSCEAVA